MEKSKAESGRSETWRGVIAEQKRSGLSVRAFCAQRGVREPSFYAWRKRLEMVAPTGPRARFALVDTSGAIAKEPGYSLEVVLISGDRLRVGPGVEAASLRMALAILRERP